jgi:Collagen triple helix repeat (20 copies)
MNPRRLTGSTVRSSTILTALIACLAFVLVDRAAPVFAATGNMFVSQFDGSESAATFFYPNALAFNGDGDVFVSDSEADHYVIDEYDSSGTGKPLTEFHLGFPAYGGIAVNSNGDLFVGNFEAKTVVEYNSTGTEIATITGSKTAAGSFSPLAVAVNASGDLYVADSANGTVDEFTEPSGSGEPVPIKEFTGTESAGGTFTPEALAVNASNDLYVIDGAHAVVDELSAEGDLVKEFTGSETPQGTFGSYIFSLATAPNGELYINNGETGVVDRFSSTGIYLAQFNGNETPQGSFTYVSLAVDPSGDLYAGDTADHVVDIFSAPASGAAEYPLDVVKEGAGADEGKVISAPAGIECGATCSSEFEEGKTVTLKEAGGTIESWTGCMSEPAANECVVEITEAKMVKVKIAKSTSVPLTVYVTGQGKVNSNPAGITECASASGTCTADFQGTVALAAAAETGYVFAGWLGCKHTGETTCEVDMTSEAEVTAVFLKEGKEGTNGTVGPQGPEGEPGEPGKHGTNGTDGKEGPAGPVGAPGPTGATGSAGPVGPAGPAGKQGPAGKVQIVTCQKVGKKQKCATKTVSGTVSVTARSARATVSRHGVVYAAGIALSTHGKTSLRFVSLHKLRPGHYMLRLISGSGDHERISSEPFTLR